jgi:hypothetical protein
MPKTNLNPGFLLVLCLGLCASAPGQEPAPSSPRALLPELAEWTLAEAPSAYLPATLFEYIDGAAENYLSYGFRELIVGNYKKGKSTASLTVEVYDMGDDLRAYGVYSSERYPESRFLKIGGQGYFEDGTLNFTAGRFYVKLLCFDCGQDAEMELTAIARQVEKKAQPGNLPALLGLSFRRSDVTANSSFKTFSDAAFSIMGIRQLWVQVGVRPCHHPGERAQDAENMFNRYLDAHREEAPGVRPTDLGFHIRDRYSGNIFLARSGNLILGAMRMGRGRRDGKELPRLL